MTGNIKDKKTKTENYHEKLFYQEPRNPESHVVTK